MIKKIFSLALALVLISSIAFANEYPTMFVGKVSAGQEHALSAPFSASIASVETKTNMVVKKGDVLFKLEPSIMTSPVDGIIGSILAKPGDDLATIKELYKSAININTKVQSTLVCTHIHAAKAYEYKVAKLGEHVYIRNRKDYTQMGEGVVVARDSKGFTVEITKGDGELRFDSRVYIFRSPDFDAKTRLGGGTIRRRDPVLVNGEGVLIELLVKPGQTVKAGDPLFYYTKSSWDGASSQVLMPKDGIITKIEKKLGDAVEIDATLATYIVDEDKYITTKLNELEVSKIKVGDMVEGIVATSNETIKAKVTNIGAIPDDKDLYEVILSSDDIKPLRVGTTINFTVK